ncbi:MAG: methyl-accepting chemotaxis protein [Clostridiales bacterium]
MKLFYNMKIATKLITTFILVAMIAGIVGIYGIINMKSIQTSDLELYEKMTVPMNYLQTIAERFQRIRVESRDSVIYNNTEGIEESISLIESYRNDISKNSELLEKTILSEEYREVYNKFLETRVNYGKELDAFYKLVRENKDEEAFDLINGEMKEIADAEREAIDELVALKIKHAKVKSNKNLDASDSAISIMVALVILAMILALTLGIFISKIISKPIKKTLHMIEEMKKGHLNTRLNTRTTDEIGKMADAMDNFADDLQNNILNAMQKLSTGDINIDIKAKDDKDEISPAIQKIVDSLSIFIKEMNNMSEQHDLGDIDVSVNEKKFQGAYKEMALGVNNMVNGHISVNKKAMACISEFSKGNFDAELEKFPGKKVFINENIERLRYNIKEFIKEMNHMSEEHDLGDIDVKVDEKKFQGAYKEMALGVNNMVNGHISVNKKAMECIGEFGNGNFDAKIEKFPGKKVFINNTIETLRDNLKDVSSEIKILITASEEGKLNERGNISKFKGDWALIVKGLNGLLDNIIKPVKEASDVLKEMSEGNLQILVNGIYKGDHAEIKNALNFTIDKFNEIMNNISDSSEQVFIGSNQLSKSSQALSQGSTEQASSIEEITSSMEEIAVQTNTNNDSAAEASTIAKGSKDDAVSGNQKMQEMLKSMDDINEASKNISKIIKVIDEIAFQTNILALNAAVEAARAGQHGKGFAVVAEEVRNLAARSAEAAKETTTLIEGSIEKVNLGTKIANDTARALDQIVTGVAKVAAIVSDISVASNEQASGISQVNKAITQVSQVVQTNSATAEESASSSEELSSQAEVLKDVVSKFKLKKTVEFEHNTHRINKQMTKGLEKSNEDKINQPPEQSMLLSSKINLGDQDFGKY